MKVRVKYEKGDRVRFLGHLDVARIVNLATKTAGWPIRLTQGFSPRPRLSFYSPLPAGTAGLEELFDADLVGSRALSELAKGLSSHLPEGFSVREVCEVSPGEIALETRIVGSLYGVDVRGVDAEELSRAICAFMNETKVLFEVVRPKKSKTVDLRPFILEVGEIRQATPDRVTLDMEIKHDEGRTVRPQWVLGTLGRFGLELCPQEAIIDRRKILFE